MNEVDRLRVVYELQDQQYRAGIERMRNTTRAANSDIIAQASRAERGVTSSFKGMAGGAAVAVAGVLSILAALNKLGTYAQSYRQVENRLRSLGEYSDDAAERLTAAALRSRTGLNDMADGVARVQKATGAGFDETIRRVETLNKLMTMGGSSGSEVSSVMIQLSQALSSGVLQGDELRSLREAAPVELLDAIAKAAGGTRDQLKQMGEEGKLTSAVIVEALDAMASTADSGFSRMAPTVADGWTNINSALTTFIGRADEGLGATAALAQGMMDLSTWLSSNADLAEEIGISVQAALGTFSEYAQKAIDALGQMSDFLNTTVREAIYGPGDAFAATGMTAGEAIGAIIDALAIMNGALEGTADAVTEAFLKIPDAITGALQSAINAVIGAVEAMVNAVLEGVRSAAAQVDALTGAVARLTGGQGTNLAGGIGTVSLPRSTGLATNYSSRSVSEAYNSGYDRGAGTVNAAADAVGGFFDGIAENYERRKTELQKDAAEADSTPPGVTPPPPPGTSDSGGAGGKGSKGGRGGASRSRSGRGVGRQDEFTRGVEQIREQTAALEAEALVLAAVATSGQDYGDALEFARKKAELLHAAQQEGKQITPQLEAEIDNLAQAYVTAGMNAEQAAERLDRIREQSERGKDALQNMFGSIIDGSMSAKEAVAQLLMEIAKVQMTKALFSLPGMDSLASGIGSLLVPGFASGGTHKGGLRIVGENGPELEATGPARIWNAKQTQDMLSGGAAPKVTINNNAPGAVVSADYVTKDEVILTVTQAIASNNRRQSDQQYLRGGR